jgi:mono/diheme cytochrome c family protein
MPSRFKQLQTKRWYAAAMILGAILLSGCKPLPPSKPAAQFTPEEARGAQVFQGYCARCHYPTTTRGLRGPGLQALTKMKAMPSGAPPTDERLAQTILHGRGMMQPVPVPEEEMQALLAYLHTL